MPDPFEFRKRWFPGISRMQNGSQAFVAAMQNERNSAY